VDPLAGSEVSPTVFLFHRELCCRGGDSIQRFICVSPHGTNLVLMMSVYRVQRSANYMDAKGYTLARNFLDVLL